jgi:hypothetical protein
MNRKMVGFVCITLLMACNQSGSTPTSSDAQSSSDAPPLSNGAPILIYTDIVSGPNVGGENNKGIYLSLFGKNFGSSLSSLKVFINNVEVDNYRSLGVSRARKDIQQITVQIGMLGNPNQGVALPIKVEVNGVLSNADQTFTVIPGNIYFVDNVAGVDTTDISSGGSFAAPFKTVQQAGFSTTFQIQPASVSGAYGRVRAGDFIVMRGGTYTSVGFGSTTGSKDTKDTGYFVNALNKSGCPIGNNCAQGGGSSSGPITIMGYPTETVLIDRSNALGDDKAGGGISSADSNRQGGGFGAWWTISNLKIEAGFNDGPINTQRGELNPLGMHWRVINNELTASSCQISTKCRAGAIAGNGAGNIWLGNYGHDVFDKPDGSTDLENHGIYIGGDGSYEIAYNVLGNIPGGSGLQLNGSNINNVSFHHNIVHTVGKHGINLANGSQSNILMWNNLIYDTYYAGLRMQEDTMTGMKLFNNTFYNINMSQSPGQGVLTNDTNAAPNQLEIRNNIFWAASGSSYSSGCCNADFSGGVGVISNNLWFQNPAVAAPSFDSAAKTGDPLFMMAGTDFHLAPGSPAIDSGSAAVSDVVKNDFDLLTGNRPTGAGFDLGAFER